MKKSLGVMAIFASSVFTSLYSASSYAGSFTFSVTDPQGTPLKGAVVTLTATSAGAKSQSSSMPLAKAAMAQRDKQFDPHIVAVQKGGVVDFPNEDGIKHQVYSFSDAMQFDLLVEEGESKSGPIMNVTGAISLGCNIHDWMQAYVYVADTPWFATTDESGSITLNLPDNESFNWEIWHPRIAESEQDLSGSVNTPSDKISLTLKQELLPDYNETEDFDDFDDY